ncbi:MAG: hypothetical protein WAV32_03825 [Halobacteriota archaeon]
MQKKIAGVAVMCIIYLAAFSVVFIMPVSAILSSIDIIDQQPTVLHPGDTKEVILTLKNIGTRDASNIRLEFQVADGRNVSLAGDTVYQISTLSSGREKKVVIRDVHVEEGTPDGIYHLPIHCYWVECYTDPVNGYVCNPNEYVYVSTPDGKYFATGRDPVNLGISFIVKGEAKVTVGNVYTKPMRIKSGDKDIVINVEIGNTGGTDVHDIEARLSCNHQFVSTGTGADRTYIAALKKDTLLVAPFHVDIAEDVEAGTYRLPLVIRYKDRDSVEYELNESIEVQVGGKPRLELMAYHTEPAKINAGDQVRLYMKVRNAGTEEAKSVSVRATSGAGAAPFQFSRNSTDVGNLKVNAEGNAILEFNVDTNATTKVYPQGLELRCLGNRDSMNYTFNVPIHLDVFANMSNVSRTQEVSVSTPAPSSIPGFEAFLALMALFIISVLLMYIRKR